jgi:hypothetical protein
MAGLGGWNYAYTIGEFDPLVGWRALAAAGSAANLSDQHSYEIAVTIAGQRVSLTVDSVAFSITCLTSHRSELS